MASSYCASRFQSIRRESREVPVGSVIIGGSQPVRVQSMTTTDTLDVEATARQTIELAEAGCEIVRITAPNARAAEALAEITKRISKAKVNVPLVADIHFMPNAAMEAAKHVDKVRVNPGNYADRKNFRFANIRIPNTVRNWIGYTRNFRLWSCDAKNLGVPCALVPIMVPSLTGS